MQYQTSDRVVLCSRFLGPLLMLMISTLTTHAQLIQVPLERGPATESGTRTKGNTSSMARTQETLVLPFYDDFSSTPPHDPAKPGSGQPKQDMWLESYGVWISEGPGINSPTFNVATFDGIDSAGRRYSNEALSNGFRDTLTSQPIDLSTNTVSLSERPSVYLSFFYQWQGNGEAPDANDFMRLEFLTAGGAWVTVASKYGSDEIDKTVFTPVNVQLLENHFFHDKFQFRFRNYGNQAGPFDSWHLDYIYLDKNRNPDGTGFPDRAISSQMSQIFGRYHSVPLQHYRAAPVYNAAEVDVQNLRAGTEGSPTDINMQQTFLNYDEGVVTKIEKPFGPVGAKHPNNFLLPGERVRTILRTDVDPIDLDDPTFNFDSYFLPNADSIDLRVRLELFEPDAGIFLSNDTLSTTYRLNDYYAYDDGTAEYAAVLNQSDDQVAVGFDLLTEEPQQLVGFDIYIPQYSINGYTSATFFVMDSENGEPNNKLTSLTHIVRTEGRDDFQYVFFDPIIVQGRFFIGWKGSSAAQIRVGLDYSNNTTDLIYEDLTGVLEEEKIKWFPASSLREGSIMLRPNFGAASPNVGVVTERPRINYYPNPSNGSFYIEGDTRDIEVFSMSGQKISYTAEEESGRSLITLTDAATGLYFLKMKKGNAVVTEKLVVRR
jgi:hypothetical protein